jgi:hypothetical protein
LPLALLLVALNSWRLEKKKKTKNFKLFVIV